MRETGKEVVVGLHVEDEVIESAMGYYNCK